MFFPTMTITPWSTNLPDTESKRWAAFSTTGFGAPSAPSASADNANRSASVTTKTRIQIVLLKFTLSPFDLGGGMVATFATGKYNSEEEHHFSTMHRGLANLSVKPAEAAPPKLAHCCHAQPACVH